MISFPGVPDNWVCMLHHNVGLFQWKFTALYSANSILTLEGVLRERLEYGQSLLCIVPICTNFSHHSILTVSLHEVYTSLLAL